MLHHPFEIAQAWQDAANDARIDDLLRLSDPNIEIVGPRGSGYGHQLLRDWLGRAGAQLTMLRAFTRDDVVVLAQHGVWRSVETGEVTGERDLASRYRIADGRVTQFERYETLDAALTGAGLTPGDELIQS